MADTLAILNLARMQFSLNEPSFFGYQNSAQPIPNTAWTGITIDAAQDDNYSGHSNVTNPSRYTCQVAATYEVSGCYAPVGNNTGFRAVRIQKNGSPVLGSAVYLPPNGTAEMGVATPTVLVPLAVGDYVEVAAWQSSGGSLNTVLDVDLRCCLTVKFRHY